MRRTLTYLLAVVVGAGIAVGIVLSRQDSSPAAATPSRVDVGFARAMAVHHQQAVQMASYARDHGAAQDVRRIAVTIETTQQAEVGVMWGWLDAWGRDRATGADPMAWMGTDHHGMHETGAMPGMATPDELDELLNLTGKRLDVRFLQLMIRHHQGGQPMAQYAAKRAARPFVRLMAVRMAQEQAQEVDLMMQMLSQQGGKPLPPPPGH